MVRLLRLKGRRDCGKFGRTTTLVRIPSRGKSLAAVLSRTSTLLQKNRVGNPSVCEDTLSMAALAGTFCDFLQSVTGVRSLKAEDVLSNKLRKTSCAKTLYF